MHDWRERFNRTVMQGQKGISVLEDYGTYQKGDWTVPFVKVILKEGIHLLLFLSWRQWRN
jgi:conjugative transposon DNA recombination protein